MQLIIGHTTDKSSWIWVRGDRRNRLLRVELEALDCTESGRAKPAKKVKPIMVKVASKNDYTAVARFDSGFQHSKSYELQPSTSYKVVLQSVRGSQKVEGQLRTFPKQGATASFRFLHGSCNLPTARLTALGSTAIGLLGSAATKNALQLPISEWKKNHVPWYVRWLRWPGVRRGALGVLAWLSGLPKLVMVLTRFEQPNLQLLPSPFKPVLASCTTPVGATSPPAFMIHCGDQIYFDVDFPERRGSKHDYRRNYRQAWFEDECMKKLLRKLPHYMILDDHEIVDGFGTEPDSRAKRSESALCAYDEYVSARQPSPPDDCENPDDRKRRYYTFDHGNTSFFVLDTRTERSAESMEMIGDRQLKALELWLRKPHGLKFIVSSVPFVAELRPPGLDANGERREDERADKWSGDAWTSQRKDIIAKIYEHGVERLVFLVGDMHCAYHAKMQIGEPRRRLTVHELAGGPINQVLFARRDQFYDRYCGTFEDERGEVLPWTSTLEAFHGSSPSVLDVSVTPKSKNAPPAINWTALRTHPAPDRSVSPNLGKPRDPHILCGRIRFQREPAEVA